MESSTVVRVLSLEPQSSWVQTQPLTNTHNVPLLSAVGSLNGAKSFFNQGMGLAMKSLRDSKRSFSEPQKQQYEDDNPAQCCNARKCSNRLIPLAEVAKSMQILVKISLERFLDYR